MMTGKPFHDYVALAGNGRTGIGAIILGTIIAVLVWILGTALAVGLGALIVHLADPAAGLLPSELIAEALAGRIGSFVLFGSLAAFWPGVWLALRFVHRRAFVTVLGSTLRIDRSDTWRGLFAALVVGIATSLPWLLIDGSFERTELTMVAWLLWLAPLVGLVFLQTSAEELIFRGYLTQALAYRFQSPWVWAGIPFVSFTLLHWFAEATPWMNAAGSITIAAFALSAAVLVWLTGNLGAAVGIHWGNNIVALLVISADDETGQVALLTTRAIDDPSWTVSDATQLAILGIVSSLATVWLLVSRRSPLRLASIGQANA